MTLRNMRELGVHPSGAPQSHPSQLPQAQLKSAFGVQRLTRRNDPTRKSARSCATDSSHCYAKYSRTFASNARGL